MFISKANYLKYFSHPAFIALIMSLIIIILLPPIFVKFQAQLIKERLLQGNNRIYYCDLKNDGTSERIHLANNNQSGIPIIIVYENDGSFICDWTLPDPWILRSDLYFTDFNNDGFNNTQDVRDAIAQNSNGFADGFIVAALAPSSAAASSSARAEKYWPRWNRPRSRRRATRWSR